MVSKDRLVAYFGDIGLSDDEDDDDFTVEGEKLHLDK